MAIPSFSADPPGWREHAIECGASNYLCGIRCTFESHWNSRRWTSSAQLGDSCKHWWFCDLWICDRLLHRRFTNTCSRCMGGDYAKYWLNYDVIYGCWTSIWSVVFLPSTCADFIWCWSGCNLSNDSTAPSSSTSSIKCQ